MIDLYIIHLKKNTDRLKLIKKNFNMFNLHIINAIKHSDGWKGCLASHQKCIKLAQQKNLEYIIVLEDDCIPTIHFNENIYKIIKYLEQNKDSWDIFLGGVTYSWVYTNLIKIEKNLNLIKINKGKTTHFMIYNKSSYNFFLNSNIDTPIDKCWWNKLNVYTCIPFIAKQHNGYSDIENQNVDYNSRYDNIENHFKKKINLLC